VDFSVYQSASAHTWVGMEGNDAVYYLTMGLVSEAGEVAGKVKKALRDHNGQISEERNLAIADELGDVLWYVARLADELHWDLNQVARNNLQKLADRKERGVICGDGDKR
jgi:NTP pyrophosphatase (non-canonical NTP hydrolase)